MLRWVDVSRYQVERSNPLDLARAREAGMQIANVALTGGRGYVSGSWAKVYLDRAQALGLGRSTYHWLDGITSGAAQARVQLARMRSLLGPSLEGVAHCVDVEETGEHGITPPKWQHVYDYVHAMQDALGRHIAVYSGDHYWAPRGWPGSSLTPYVMGAPNAGWLPAEPGAISPHWSAGWGGWPEFAILQWGVRPLPGTSDCSLSLIRDHGVWADLTGGDALMPHADPGNAQPDAWAGPPMSAAALDDLREVATILPPVEAVEAPRQDPRSLPLAPRGATAEVCAPTITAEHADWRALGGTSLGCVGDERHGTGFHRGANYVPATDYSRRRDPIGAAGPYVNWNYACAGDFRHGGVAVLRELGRIVLAELMAGRWPMIGEFIGQPWPDRPVMYWSRWEGRLREYTGSGHDLWFHISYFRSRVNVNPRIWQNAVRIRDEATMTPAQMAELKAHIDARLTALPAAPTAADVVKALMDEKAFVPYADPKDPMRTVRVLLGYGSPTAWWHQQTHQKVDDLATLFKAFVMQESLDDAEVRAALARLEAKHETPEIPPAPPTP